MEIFQALTIETAPVASRDALEEAKKAFGRVPEALARLAASPLALEAFHAFTGVFSKSTLSDMEREVVIMTVAFENECELCMAMHSRILRAKKTSPTLVDGLRQGTPLGDPRLDALRTFTLSVMSRRGASTDDDVHALVANGFTTAQALDVVVGVAAYTLSTYANRLTRAPVDAFLAPHAWAKPPAT